MSNKGLGAHRGGRGRDSRPGTNTQAQIKKKLGPNYKVFQDAASQGWEREKTDPWSKVGNNAAGFERVVFTKGDMRLAMIVNHPSGRVREATVGRKHKSGGHEVIDEVAVGAGNRREKVRGFLKKYGGS